MKYSWSPIILILRKIAKLCEYWNSLMSKSFFSSIRRKESDKMYTFRPYELVKVNYKCYKGIFNKGINSYPRPRSGHRIVCNDSDLYCFGGFNPNISDRARVGGRTLYLFQELWKFDLFTKKWNIVYSPTIEGMPEELASNAVILRNNMLLVFGGTGYPFGSSCSNKCFLFWPYNKRPKTISPLETTGEGPLPQYGQAVTLHNDYLYVVGGTTGFEYSCDVYRLHLVTKVWECISICREDIREDPKGRYRHEIVTDDANIYVLGGGNADTAYSLEHIPVFSFELQQWTVMHSKPDASLSPPGYPEPRKCHSCVQYDTDNGIEVVIAGGFFEDLAFFDDIWKLNLSTLQWTLLKTARLPYPLYFHDAATSGNGQMYIFGGVEVKGLEDDPDNEVYESERTNEVYSMWTTIPKLSEISWQAVLHYNPKLPTYSLTEMLEMGISMKFASRISRSTRLA
ncbi:Kelch domain-containing protein 10 like [Pseudolycoriella hygida]|uniref:Kelch domain-containing protein 10 like n=1 Tax=Pseudolycoriella hygida TaxID=35572 RepID=A0A9Q0S5J4_9DIPT|nr:Kelch domain-containing protein 10 like [Pseudolycoriella hygida]